MRLSFQWWWSSSFVLLCSVVAGIEVDVESPDSIKAAASVLAEGLLDYYPVYKNEPGAVYGLFVGGYYWYEAGAAFGSLIDYWYYTGDDQYNELVIRSILNQVGDDQDFMPVNQTLTEGNDDQAFWALATIGAAERNFTNPADNEPQWLYLTQAAFNTMRERWDYRTCGGGLRWQIFAFNNGYDYKNTVSNGAFFHLAARLYRYTGNETYLEWAEISWDWMVDAGFITSDYLVLDGANVDHNCSEISQWRWSYNYGFLLSGAAYLYNFTEDTIWQERMLGIVNSSSWFFSDDGIMYERTCEPSRACNTDMQAFKAYFSRFMGLTMQVAPETIDILLPRLKTSALAAAASCSGGTDGVTCGTTWVNSEWDGTWGLGQQMNALEVTTNLLAPISGSPLTPETGATSNGSDEAGLKSHKDIFGHPYRDPTIADKAGAGVLTGSCILMLIIICWWMAA